jgi:hypothetical protein
MFKVKTNLGKLRRLFGDAPRKVQQVTAEHVQESLDIVHNEIGREIKRFAKKPSGRLFRSFTKTVRTTGRQAIGAIKSDAPHAFIHEFGGVITPKRVKWLTVPLTPIAKRRRARHWRKLFVPPGTRVLATKAGHGFVPQYALRKSVRIRPKRYLSRAVRNSAKQIEQRLGRQAARMLRVR